MEQHFRIGEVAEMFDTSIRAIRLYDKMNLFKPEHIDPDTGYRYYTADQMPALNTMLVLKGIGFRLLEIRELMERGMDPALLLERLARKKDALENEIEIARFNVENIERIERAVREQSYGGTETAGMGPSMKDAGTQPSAGGMETAGMGPSIKYAGTQPSDTPEEDSGNACSEESATDPSLRTTPTATDAYRLSRLVCLENLKIATTLSEVLWL